MRILLKLVREGLGRLIILINFLFRPKQIRRTPAEQDTIKLAAEGLSLYQFYACPFCIKTRRAMHRLNLPIATRDAQNNDQHRTELEASGGRIKVPCLRITEKGNDTWMYESSEIIEYLEARFA